MKNTVKIDMINCRLIMDRTFAKKASNVRSEEYEILQNVRRDYPNYEVVVRKIKKNPNKKTYSGLTYQYMEDYIRTHGTREEITKNLKEFEEMKIISQCHSKGFRYPTIKKWFLEKYPEIALFGGDPAETEITNTPINDTNTAA